jgi:hypothetical protein
MGQVLLTDQNNRNWMAGWDNPTGGYYAQRFGEREAPMPCEGCYGNPDPGRDCDECPLDKWQEFDVLLGFGRGIPNLEDLAIMMRHHGFTPTGEQLEMLARDGQESEKPLTSLQRKIQFLMREALEPRMME